MKHLFTFAMIATLSLASFADEPLPPPHPTPGPLPGPIAPLPTPQPPPHTSFVCGAKGLIETHGLHLGQARNQYDAEQAALFACFSHHRRCRVVTCSVL